MRIAATKMPMNTFWQNVKQQLDIRGANWSWLRERIGGKAASSMSNMQKTWPRLDDAMRIAEALEVPIHSLYYGTEKTLKAALRTREICAAIRDLSDEEIDRIKLIVDTLRWKSSHAKLSRANRDL